MSKKMTPDRPKCEHCGQAIKDDWREITLSKSLAEAIWRVYKWSEEKQRDEFNMGDVKHLLSQSQYATFNDIPKISPKLIDRDRDSRLYQISRDNCREFFKGKIVVSISVWKHGITGEIRPGVLGHVSELKGIHELMDADGDFIAKYINTEPPRLFQI